MHIEMQGVCVGCAYVYVGVCVHVRACMRVCFIILNHSDNAYDSIFGCALMYAIEPHH